MIAALLSPLGRWVGGALFALAFLAGTYALGNRHGTQRNEAKWQAASAAEITRQANVRAKALDEAVARELARAAENEQLEQKVLDYEAYLAKRPAPAGCILDRDTVDRLRKLQPPGSP
jgi:hypothetical protein